MSAEIVGAVALLLLALAHSVLGELGVIGPLLEADWQVPMPRRISEMILRGAWHLPSLAWIAIAVVLVNGPMSLALAVAAGVPGVVLFLRMRAHLAWPLFLLVAMVGLWSDGVVGSGVAAVVAAATAVALGLAALLHLYWALGGLRFADKVLPQRADSAAKVFNPGRWLTLVVAALFAGFAVVVATVAAGSESAILRALVAGGALVLAARAVGDNRYAGFTKSIRDTAFAVADDRYLTPLAVFLAFGSSAALLMG